MDYRDIITIEPGKRSGQPCIRGLRMTVQDVLEYLAGGMTEGEILDDFPDLTHADIRACLAFASSCWKLHSSSNRRFVALKTASANDLSCQNIIGTSVSRFCSIFG